MPRLYFNRAFYTRARRDVVFGFVVNPDRAGGDPSVRAVCLALGCSRERSGGTRARRGKQHVRRNLARIPARCSLFVKRLSALRALGRCPTDVLSDDPFRLMPCRERFGR